MFPKPFPERGTALTKDFYTKLFPERSRSRSGTRNVATFHVPGFYGHAPSTLDLGTELADDDVRRRRNLKPEPTTNLPRT